MANSYFSIANTILIMDRSVDDAGLTSPGLSNSQVKSVGFIKFSHCVDLLVLQFIKINKIQNQSSPSKDLHEPPQYWTDFFWRTVSYQDCTYVFFNT